MFKKIGVVGLGTMGASIAEVMVFNGLDVTIVDQTEELVKNGLKKIENIMAANVQYSKSKAEKEIRRIESLGLTLTSDQKNIIENKMKQDFTEGMMNEAMGKIKSGSDFSILSDCDYVVEAVFEKMDIKLDVFRKLSHVCSQDSVLSSNSSSLSITKIASEVSNPGRVILTHFFNPPYTLPLIEVVSAIQTSAATEKKTIDFYSGVKNHRGFMKPIKVKEVPGFLVNRILVPMMNEAAFALDEGVASREDIDTAMKLGAGMPMGPLELSDMVGIDVALDVMEILQKEYGDPKYRPSLILKKMRDSQKLGRKTKTGFYDYKK
ncbi:MAG: 3-hydroxyacyl-CoA dehydrogenase family protein [Thermoplasmataceae archaeon]